jgi:hypothetical protein
LGERVILAGRNKDVEERNVTLSFSQSPERATATRGWVPLVNNKHIFNLNKEIHKYKTRALKNLHLLAINVRNYSKCAYIAGIRVCNHLPLSMKMLATDTSFKTALKRFLYHHSFYSMNEYFQQNWS